MTTDIDEPLRTHVRRLADTPHRSIDDLEHAVLQRFGRRRRTRRMLASVGAAALIGAGAVAVQAARDDAPNVMIAGTSPTALVADVPPGSTTAPETNPPTTTEPDVDVDVAVEAIDVDRLGRGGAQVTFTFDGELPDIPVAFARDIHDVDAPGIAYTVQDPASEIYVCESWHYFTGAKTGSVDVLIPSDWWRTGIDPQEHELAYDRSIEHPGKIVGCGPYMGYVQYSIWAPQSDDPADIQVSVSDDQTQLVVSIRPS